MGRTNILLRKRFFISLIIWFVNVLVWILAAIVTNTGINEARRISGAFWVLFFLLYGIQTFPYWRFLQKHNEDKKGGNVALVLLMPLIILLSLWLFFLIDAAVKSTLGGFS